VQFINAMPVEERTELTDKSGRPTTQAIDRLANAIFQKAYGSDSLIDLYAQAADPEAKTILNALARVAPKMAQLEGAGEYDVRAQGLPVFVIPTMIIHSFTFSFDGCRCVEGHLGHGRRWTRRRQ
jgi:hypothetical protein